MPPAKKINAVQKGKKSPKTANDAVKKPAVATRRSRRLAGAAAEETVDGDAAVPSRAANAGATDAAATASTAKKPAAAKCRGRKARGGDNADDDAAADGTPGPSGTAGNGAANSTTTAADTAHTGGAPNGAGAAASAAAPPAGAMTRSRRRALDAAGGNTEEPEEEQLSPEEIARREEERKEEEREHRREKREAARENKATIPPLQSADNADDFYERRGSRVEQMRGEEDAQREADKEKEAAEAAQSKADADKAAAENLKEAAEAAQAKADADQAAARNLKEAAEAARAKADADKAAVENLKAARPTQRLKLIVTKGPAKLSLTVGQRSEEIEADRQAKIKEREDRAARGEPVTPSPVSSPRSEPPASSPSSQSAVSDPGTPPRRWRFLCGVDGCSGGAYDFVGLRSHYKSVHKGKGMPKSENDVRKADFVDWLNDRIDGNHATRQAKTQYSDWLGVYPNNDKENDSPEDALSDASSGTRKRRREEASSQGDGQAGQAPKPKRRQQGGKSKYGDWPDEDEAFERRMKALREAGLAPLEPTQGQNFVEQAHLEEIQRISDEQEDQNKKLRKTLRQNQLQLEAARRAGDYAIYQWNNAKERQRALEQIASDNNVSLPKTEDADEYQKLLLKQAFGEEEPEFLDETRRWEWNLLQRRTYHVHRRRDQTDDEWDAEESRVNEWQEPTDMEVDTDAPHNSNEMTAEGLVFDGDGMPPRPAYAVPQNNLDDNVSITGQDQEAEVGRRLAYPQRRFLREWATVEQILPRATILGLAPANHGQAGQSPANQPAEENQQQESDQPTEENQQHDPDEPAQEDQEQDLDQPPEENQGRDSSEQNQEWRDVSPTVVQKRLRKEQKEREKVSRQARNSENLVNLSDSDDEQPTSSAASQMPSRPSTAAQGSSGPARQSTENAPADDAAAQQPQQGGFKPPVSRSKNGKWPCTIM